jgi:hypothetical protein
MMGMGLECYNPMGNYPLTSLPAGICSVQRVVACGVHGLQRMARLRPVPVVRVILMFAVEQGDDFTSNPYVLYIYERKKQRLGFPCSNMFTAK